MFGGFKYKPYLCISKLKLLTFVPRGTIKKLKLCTIDV